MVNRFTEDGNVIEFDGSQMNGRSEIATQIQEVFAHHETASYVSIVREVGFLSTEAVLVRAVVGMVPPGQADINPAVNAIQSLYRKTSGSMAGSTIQNTPAAFHRRSELSRQLTEELRQLLKNSKYTFPALPQTINVDPIRESTRNSNKKITYKIQVGFHL